MRGHLSHVLHIGLYGQAVRAHVCKYPTEKDTRTAGFCCFFLLWFFVVAVVGWLVEFDFDLLCFFPDKTFPKWKQ